MADFNKLHSLQADYVLAKQESQTKESEVLSSGLLNELKKKLYGVSDTRDNVPKEAPSYSILIGKSGI